MVKLNTYLSLLPVLICISMLWFPIHLVISIEIYLIFLIYFFTKYSNQEKKFKYAILVSLSIRFLIIIIDESIRPILPEQTDTILYNTAAQQILKNYTDHLPFFYQVDPVTNVRSYGLFISLLYKLFGESLIIARLANAIIGIFVAILIYKICIKLFADKKAAFISMSMVLFWPSILIFNSYALRDTLISLITFLIIYKLVLISFKEKTKQNLVFIFIMLIIMYFFRSQNVFLYFGIFFLYTLIIIYQAQIPVIYKLLLFSFMSLLLLFVFYRLSPLIIEVATYPFRAQPTRAEGGSVYLQNMVYSSYTDIIFNLPIRFIYFTFGPFLWNVKTFFQLISAIEGFFVITSFILFVKHLFKAKNIDNIQLFLYIFCFAGLFANSMIDSNFGTAIRHRIDYIIIFFIFTGIYLKNFRIRII